MQMTIRIPDEYMEQVQHISLRTGLKKSDIARLAIKDFLERFDLQEQEDKPIHKASDLIGVVRSGIPDLGRNHRRHILKGIKDRES
ncbi:ribbon-helix-helix protein, CopG family [Desulfonatronum parangueonense]